MTGYTNREVAEFLLPRLGAEYGGCVYLDESHDKTILLRSGATMGLERCGLPKEQRFSFFDQVTHHTQTADPPMPQHRTLTDLGPSQ